VFVEGVNIGSTITQRIIREVEFDSKKSLFTIIIPSFPSILEVVEIAGEIIGIEPKINYLAPRKGEIGNFVADTLKLKKLFKLVPKIGIEDGLKRTFEWLKK
jgi:nucleoside-diphosphate-sugar epimerase